MITPWLPALPALLLEAFLYFGPTFPAFRNRVLRYPPALVALFTAITALLPALLLNAAAGIWPVPDLLLLTGSVAFVCAWYFIVPRTGLSDILLMAMLAGFVLSPWYKDLFPAPGIKSGLSALAKILWMRLGIWLILFVRRMDVPGFGLWPDRKDWLEALRSSALFFLLFAPYVAMSKTMRLQMPNVSPALLPLYVPALFAGVYLTIAMGEEFFFRGVLQSVLKKEWRSQWPAILVSSLLFGAVHLPFRNQFPNWRFAAMAAVAGAFYGLAFDRARSLRAAMLTHSIVVTIWMVAFSRSL